MNDEETSNLRKFLDGYRIDIVCNDESVFFVMGGQTISQASRETIGNLIRAHGHVPVLNQMWGPVYHEVRRLAGVDRSFSDYKRQADETVGALFAEAAEMRAELEHLRKGLKTYPRETVLQAAIDASSVDITEVVAHAEGVVARLLGEEP